MKFDPKVHHRRSIRLKEYDYSQAGAYFVTMVTRQPECLFGEVVNGEMTLNDLGKIADEFWRAIPGHFPNVELGEYVVMPNHVHGIIEIGRGVVPTPDEFYKSTAQGGITPPLQKPTLGQIVAYF